MNVKEIIKEVNSWNEFKYRLDILQNKEKGDAFELLTKLYFKIDPALSNYYDEVWLFSEIPQLDLDYLGLPSHDLGIDLIAKNGIEYHAIQCKYHSNKNQSVTFKEVSTFISLLESNGKISQGYICSSAFVTSRNFNKLKTKPINLLMSDTWQQLDEVFFNQACKFLEDKKTELEPFKPYQHQQKAINDAIAYFVKGNESRGKLIFPCGSGKSLTGFWITQELKSKSTIVAVPSLSLVKQTLEVYLREVVANNNLVKWLCICSDEGIGRNDDVIYYTENIGVPSQTDSVFIENWLDENRNEVIIIFTTYQSGRIIADVSKKLNFSFDVGVFDEAHKTVGSNKKLYSHLLFDENISIDKRIFMTATERFYAGSKDDIISMDDYDIYGDTFTHLSFKEAIELDLLTDYKVITIDIKKSEIAKFIKENNLVQLNDKWKKETEARSLASMLALRKAMKQFNIKNAVSFHSSIEKAVRNKELQQYITSQYNYQPIDAYTVSSKISTTKRNDIVQEFAASDKALITNARCLTEGVDVPNIDCIVFADPRRSKVDIVQALGRALRKKEGKDWGYVILPVVYDEETNEIDNKNFNEILAIVRGLASNDERIIDYFKDKERIKGYKERSEQFKFEVFSEYIDEEELIKELQIKLWDKLAKFNWLEFKEAREYVRNLGLNNQYEWTEYCKSYNRRIDIPSMPSRVYKDKGWKNLGDWLGTGFVATHQRNYKSYEDAREFVKGLGFRKGDEWLEYCRSGDKPEDIPSCPIDTYKNKGWKGIGDWLGTRSHPYHNREYKSYKNARDFARSLGFNKGNDWKDYCKTNDLPNDIPSYPQDLYLNKGWKGWGDFLGTGNIAPKNKVFGSFNEVRNYVHKLGLKSVKDWKVYWKEYCKSDNKKSYIPSHPDLTYKNKGWIGYGDWLGTGNIAHFKKLYLTFEEAREFVHDLNLKNGDDWKEYCRSGDKPDNIPSYPYGTYKNKGWNGLKDWLGSGNNTNNNEQYKLF